MRLAPLLLVGVLGGCAGATAAPASPTPTAAVLSLPPAPPRSAVLEVREAVVAAHPGRRDFDVLLVDADTAVATDDRTWALTVRREAGTWTVDDVASLG